MNHPCLGLRPHTRPNRRLGAPDSLVAVQSERLEQVAIVSSQLRKVRYCYGL